MTKPLLQVSVCRFIMSTDIQRWTNNYSKPHLIRMGLPKLINFEKNYGLLGLVMTPRALNAARWVKVICSGAKLFCEVITGYIYERVPRPTLT